MLIDTPQIAEGSSIINATVPSGSSFPTNPSRGELFYLSPGAGLHAYSGTDWVSLVVSTALSNHLADDARHLTVDQNTLVDGITVNAATINSIPSIVTTATNDRSFLTYHLTDDTRHLTTAQNNLVDAITVSAAQLNSIPQLTTTLATHKPAELYSQKPSTGLTFEYCGGNFNGNVVPDGMLSLTTGLTYIVANRTSGAVTAAQTTANWNSSDYLQLFAVTSSASAITNVVDYRQAYGEKIGLSRRVLKLTGATDSVTLNYSLYDEIRVTLAGNCTFDLTGAVDGQGCILRITQSSGGNNIVTFSSKVRFSTDLASFTASTAGGKSDRLSFIFDADATKYDLVSVLKGF